MKKSKGQTLIVVLGILVIFMIFIPALVSLVRQESLWTVKQKKSTSAFHAAEAGIDQAKWKLNENSSNAQLIFDGNVIAGYTGTTVYQVSDASGTTTLGEYKVSISSGPDDNEITIFSVGHDASAVEVRAIEVIMERAEIESSLSVSGAIQYKPNMNVHWGPVVTYTSIDHTNYPYFPRKFSKGQIAGRDTNPTEPNSDEKEYWAFEDLGTEPQILLSYYSDLAEKSVIPADQGGQDRIKKKTGNDTAVAVPAGSGYFPAASNNGGIRLNSDYYFDNSTSVIYTDGTVDYTQQAFVHLQALVCEGNMDFKAGGTSVTVNVPVNAAEEYVKEKELDSTYTFPGEGSATYSVTDAGFHGFLYCGGNMSNSAAQGTIVGAIKVIGGVTINTLTVFFDKDVAKDIKLSDNKLTQSSWREVNATW